MLASVKGYPFPAYSTNLGSTFASVFFGLVYVFTFCITVVVVVKGVTVEKELRIREGMKIFGLSDLAYWSSWFVTSYTSLLLVSLLVSVVGIYPFRYTDWTLTFAFLALWTCQLVAFCFCLTTFFSSAKVAAIASALVYVVTWVPGVSAVAADNMGSDSWIASCVMMPATCVYMWGWVVSILENAQKGARWDTVSLNLLEAVRFQQARARARSLARSCWASRRATRWRTQFWRGTDQSYPVRSEGPDRGGLSSTPRLAR